MSQRNGYFYLDDADGGVFLKLIPPVDGGEQIKLSEVAEYLNDLNIPAIDLNKLHAAIMRNTQNELKINIENIQAVHEKMNVYVDKDHMKATCRFYPPSARGKKMGADEIKTNLVRHGIIFGIQEQLISELVLQKEYCTDYAIALGKVPEEGEDAEITYHFNTKLNSKPKLNEDGSVDFFHLDNIAHVKKGQVLATLTKEIQGINGQTVYGKNLLPQKVKKLSLKQEKHTILSEDRLQLFSDSDGHVRLDSGQIIVSNVFEVSKDVDTSTGDIDYEGNIVVKGNVMTGFSIRAKGNIEVNGVVEGATLIAGGQIILKRGIQGMNRGILRAEGDIIAKFVESADVTTGGSLNTESILYSKISAKGEIRISGKRGFVTGGMVRATSLISAITIGAPMGTKTLIEVGVDPVMKERYQTLTKDMHDWEKSLATMKPVVTAFGKRLGKGEKLAPDKVKQIQMLAKECQEKEQLLSDGMNEIQELKELFAQESDARIKVSGTIYPGVRLTISDLMLYIQDERTYCQFVKQDGEIKSIPL